MLKQFALCFDLSLANHGIPSLQMVSYDTDVRGDELNSISPSQVLPVRGTPREKESFKVRERGRDANREDGIERKEGESLFHREAQDLCRQRTWIEPL